MPTKGLPGSALIAVRVAPYPADMIKRSVKELSSDPFLIDLERYGDHKIASQGQAAGYLNKSISTLSDWRKKGKRPPGWIDDDGIGYPVGELKRYVQEQLARTASPDASTSAATPSPPTTSTAADADGVPLSGEALEAYGMDEPMMRGGRRKKVAHATFAGFLSTGLPDDEWVFVVVPERRLGNIHRPVDLIASMDLPWEQVRDATCEQLTLSHYLDRMAEFSRLAADYLAGQARASERAALLDQIAPTSNGKGRGRG